MTCFKNGSYRLLSGSDGIFHALVREACLCSPVDLPLAGLDVTRGFHIAFAFRHETVHGRARKFLVRRLGLADSAAMADPAVIEMSNTATRVFITLLHSASYE